MSTKIYNGYILSEKNFYELNQRLQELAVKMKKIKLNHCAVETAQVYADYVDSFVLFGRKPTLLEDFNGDSTLDFLDAMEKKVKESHASPYRSQGEWDLECSVTLYPLKDGKIL